MQSDLRAFTTIAASTGLSFANLNTFECFYDLNSGLRILIYCCSGASITPSFSSAPRIGIKLKSSRIISSAH